MNLYKFKVVGMQNSRGFTLVELMVTIAVVAILAVIAAPSMGNMIAKQRLDTTARDLAYIFSKARGQAALLQSEVTVDFDNQPDTETQFYWSSKYDDVVLTTDPIQVRFSPTGKAFNRSKLVANPNFVAPETPSNPKQIPEAVPLTFSVCSQKLKQTRTVSISVTGVIERIQNVTGGC